MYAGEARGASWSDGGTAIRLRRARSGTAGRHTRVDEERSFARAAPLFQARKQLLAVPRVGAYRDPSILNLLPVGALAGL